ncbi:hypothetical protein LCGC14_2706860 [marine sediment metagenome]|uniref:DUF4326 domain-containing protein n=1 Tax=marine sediment metagenome TaxID=412755 RepID=A0A0F9BN70_9ZZZZ
MPKVLNKRTDNIPPEAIYVGRPSKWGNPFNVVVHTLSQHEAAVDYFRAYAEERLVNEPAWLEPLRGKDLVCWCKPLPCPADLLVALANRPATVDKGVK